MQKELEKNLAATRQTVEDIQQSLNALTDEEYYILDILYIQTERETIAHLCVELGYSKATMYQKRDAALRMELPFRFFLSFSLWAYISSRKRMYLLEKKGAEYAAMESLKSKKRQTANSSPASETQIPPKSLNFGVLLCKKF